VAIKSDYYHVTTLKHNTSIYTGTQKKITIVIDLSVSKSGSLVKELKAGVTMFNKSQTAISMHVQ